MVAWHDCTTDTLNIQVNNGVVNTASHSGGVHGACPTTLLTPPRGETWHLYYYAAGQRIATRVLTSEEVPLFDRIAVMLVSNRRCPTANYRRSVSRPA